MARTYKRDTFGRFAGGGGGGGKPGKSAKKQTAKAGAPNAMGRGYLKTARANMTRTTNKLTGRGAASRPAAGPVAARPASAPASAPGGRMRQSRDNAGRITAAGQGATARGGRLRTASGKKRAVQTARIAGGGANTIARVGRLRTASGNRRTAGTAELAGRIDVPVKKGGGGRRSGGSSVAAGRKAQARYKMQQANKRFKKSKLPPLFGPRYTRNGRLG